MKERSRKMQVEMLRRMVDEKICYRMNLRWYDSGVNIYEDTVLYGYNDVFVTIDDLFLVEEKNGKPLFTPHAERLQSGYARVNKIVRNDFSLKKGRGKQEIDKLSVGEAAQCFVLDKYLDWFDTETCQLYIRTEFDPIVAVEGGEVIGLIMPFIAKK